MEGGRERERDKDRESGGKRERRKTYLLPVNFSVILLTSPRRDLEIAGKTDKV